LSRNEPLDIMVRELGHHLDVLTHAVGRSVGRNIFVDVGIA
jgi:hypothetical protein